MIKWGVLGAGNIARRFIKSLEYCEDGIFYAIGSYSKDKRDDFIDKGCIVYDNYYDLLDDENVDVVYIANIHSMHYKWAKEAIQRGKHVLCEKPATLSYNETKELCELSKRYHVLFLEGMKSRFIPLMNLLKSMFDKGEFGTIERIETSFCSEVTDKDCYVFDKIQGGALYDVGIYNIAVILDFIKSDINSIFGFIEFNDSVDCYDFIELSFDNGVSALIECAIDRAKDKGMSIYTSKGVLKASPFYRPEIAYFNDQVIELKYIYDDFYTEIKEVHKCIKNNQYESVRMSHSDSLECIKVIEMIRESSLWLKS